MRVWCSQQTAAGATSARGGSGENEEYLLHGSMGIMLHKCASFDFNAAVRGQLVAFVVLNRPGFRLAQPYMTSLTDLAVLLVSLKRMAVNEPSLLMQLSHLHSVLPGSFRLLCFSSACASDFASAFLLRAGNDMISSLLAVAVSSLPVVRNILRQRLENEVLGDGLKTPTSQKRALVAGKTPFAAARRLSEKDASPIDAARGLEVLHTPAPGDGKLGGRHDKSLKNVLGSPGVVKAGTGSNAANLFVRSPNAGKRRIDIEEEDELARKSRRAKRKAGGSLLHVPAAAAPPSASAGATSVAGVNAPAASAAALAAERADAAAAVLAAAAAVTAAVQAGAGRQQGWRQAKKRQRSRCPRESWRARTRCAGQ